MTNLLKVCLVLALSVFGLLPGFAASKTVAPAAVPQMTSDEKALHALNRLAFGPRPGDLEAVKQMGLKEWISRQLQPSSIAENPILTAKLEPLDTLRMSSVEVAQKYPPLPLIRLMIQGKQPWPTDPETRLMIREEITRYRERLKGKDAAGPMQATQADFEKATAFLKPDQKEIFSSGTPQQKVALLSALPLQQQFDVITNLTRLQRRQIFGAASPELRRRVMKFSGPQAVLNQDLAQGKIYRAVYSNRQLEEVLTDFWYNHFNVSMDKAADRYLASSYERDSIRPYVLGKFKDLLTATAQSPAMLFYLDNFQSVGPNAPQDNSDPNRAKRGLNENYGRELMELHTLGVDGGYTQKDVTEVARCFTGWTIKDVRRGAGFEFNDKLHDKGEKHVLGVTIPAGGGIDDGYKVIDILARHPSTAKFVSRSIAVRFVSDNPPEHLVTRMAATFTKTNGDLREVMKTMLDSPEFWSQDEYRAKIKSPFEMVASALRATNADVEYAQSIVGQLNTLGEPLFRKLEPTGYSNKGSDWMNSAALLGRMNFALAVTGNKVPGVRVPVAATTDLDSIARSILMADLTPDSHRVVENGIAQGPALIAGLKAESPGEEGQEMDSSAVPVKPAQWHGPTAEFIAGLTIGSPDFQRR